MPVTDEVKLKLLRANQSDASLFQRIASQGQLSPDQPPSQSDNSKTHIFRGHSIDSFQNVQIHKYKGPHDEYLIDIDQTALGKIIQQADANSYKDQIEGSLNSQTEESQLKNSGGVFTGGVNEMNYFSYREQQPETGMVATVLSPKQLSPGFLKKQLERKRLDVHHARSLDFGNIEGEIAAAGGGGVKQLGLGMGPERRKKSGLRMNMMTTGFSMSNPQFLRGKKIPSVQTFGNERKVVFKFLDAGSGRSVETKSETGSSDVESPSGHLEVSSGKGSHQVTSLSHFSQRYSSNLDKEEGRERVPNVNQESLEISGEISKPGFADADDRFFQDHNDFVPRFIENEEAQESQQIRDCILPDAPREEVEELPVPSIEESERVAIGNMVEHYLTSLKEGVTSNLKKSSDDEETQDEDELEDQIGDQRRVVVRNMVEQYLKSVKEGVKLNLKKVTADKEDLGQIEGEEKGKVVIRNTVEHYLDNLKQEVKSNLKKVTIENQDSEEESLQENGKVVIKNIVEHYLTALKAGVRLNLKNASADDGKLEERGLYQENQEIKGQIDDSLLVNDSMFKTYETNQEEAGEELNLRQKWWLTLKAKNYVDNMVDNVCFNLFLNDGTNLKHLDFESDSDLAYDSQLESQSEDGEIVAPPENLKAQTRHSDHSKIPKRSPRLSEIDEVKDIESQESSTYKRPQYPASNNDNTEKAHHSKTSSTKEIDFSFDFESNEGSPISDKDIPQTGDQEETSTHVQYETEKFSMGDFITETRKSEDDRDGKIDHSLSSKNTNALEFSTSDKKQFTQSMELGGFESNRLRDSIKSEHPRLRFNDKRKSKNVEEGVVHLAGHEEGSGEQHLIVGMGKRGVLDDGSTVDRLQIQGYAAGGMSPGFAKVEDRDISGEWSRENTDAGDFIAIEGMDDVTSRNSGVMKCRNRMDSLDVSQRKGNVTSIQSDRGELVEGEDDFRLSDPIMPRERIERAHTVPNMKNRFKTEGSGELVDNISEDDREVNNQYNTNSEGESESEPETKNDFIKHGKEKVTLFFEENETDRNYDFEQFRKHEEGRRSETSEEMVESDGESVVNSYQDASNDMEIEIIDGFSDRNLDMKIEMEDIGNDSVDKWRPSKSLMDIVAITEVTEDSKTKDMSDRLTISNSGNKGSTGEIKPGNKKIVKSKVGKRMEIIGLKYRMSEGQLPKVLSNSGTYKKSPRISLKQETGFKYEIEEKKRMVSKTKSLLGEGINFWSNNNSLNMSEASMDPVSKEKKVVEGVKIEQEGLTKSAVQLETIESFGEKEMRNIKEEEEEDPEMAVSQVISQGRDIQLDRIQERQTPSPVQTKELDQSEAQTQLKDKPEDIRKRRTQEFLNTLGPFEEGLQTGCLPRSKEEQDFLQESMARVKNLRSISDFSDWEDKEAEGQAQDFIKEEMGKDDESSLSDSDDNFVEDETGSGYYLNKKQLKEMETQNMFVCSEMMDRNQHFSVQEMEMKEIQMKKWERFHKKSRNFSDSSEDGESSGGSEDERYVEIGSDVENEETNEFKNRFDSEVEHEDTSEFRNRFGNDFDEDSGEENRFTEMRESEMMDPETESEMEQMDIFDPDESLQGMGGSYEEDTGESINLKEENLIKPDTGRSKEKFFASNEHSEKSESEMNEGENDRKPEDAPLKQLIETLKPKSQENHTSDQIDKNRSKMLESEMVEREDLISPLSSKSSSQIKALYAHKSKTQMALKRQSSKVSREEWEQPSPKSSYLTVGDITISNEPLVDRGEDDSLFHNALRESDMLDSEIGRLRFIAGEKPQAVTTMERRQGDVSRGQEGLRRSDNLFVKKKAVKRINVSVEELGKVGEVDSRKDIIEYSQSLTNNWVAEPKKAGGQWDQRKQTENERDEGVDHQEVLEPVTYTKLNLDSHVNESELVLATAGTTQNSLQDSESLNEIQDKESDTHGMSEDSVPLENIKEKLIFSNLKIIEVQDEETEAKDQDQDQAISKPDNENETTHVVNTENLSQHLIQTRQTQEIQDIETRISPENSQIIESKDRNMNIHIPSSNTELDHENSKDLPSKEQNQVQNQNEIEIELNDPMGEHNQSGSDMEYASVETQQKYSLNQADPQKRAAIKEQEAFNRAPTQSATRTQVVIVERGRPANREERLPQPNLSNPSFPQIANASNPENKKDNRFQERFRRKNDKPPKLFSNTAAHKRLQAKKRAIKRTMQQQQTQAKPKQINLHKEESQVISKMYQGVPSSESKYKSLINASNSQKSHPPKRYSELRPEDREKARRQMEISMDQRLTLASSQSRQLQSQNHSVLKSGTTTGQISNIQLYKEKLLSEAVDSRLGGLSLDVKSRARSNITKRSVVTFVNAFEVDNLDDSIHMTREQYQRYNSQIAPAVGGHMTPRYKVDSVKVVRNRPFFASKVKTKVKKPVIKQSYSFESPPQTAVYRSFSPVYHIANNQSHTVVRPKNEYAYGARMSPGRKVVQARTHSYDIVKRRDISETQKKGSRVVVIRQRSPFRASKRPVHQPESLSSSKVNSRIQNKVPPNFIKKNIELVRKLSNSRREIREKSLKSTKSGRLQASKSPLIKQSTLATSVKRKSYREIYLDKRAKKNALRKEPVTRKYQNKLATQAPQAKESSKEEYKKRFGIKRQRGRGPGQVEVVKRVIRNTRVESSPPPMGSRTRRVHMVKRKDSRAKRRPTNEIDRISDNLNRSRSPVHLRNQVTVQKGKQRGLRNGVKRGELKQRKFRERRYKK